MSLNMALLRIQNVRRLARWHSDSDAWTGADWSNAMAGEAGEACNVVKKLRRHETHLGTSYNTPPRELLIPWLAHEIADTVIYADLLAHHYGIDLAQAIREKFNIVSEAQGFPERI
jgi:NTP pyrophosphatase (non-canonical NTP hydrolase)